MGSLSLPEGFFPTQESNPGLLNCRWIPYQLIYKGILKPLNNKLASGAKVLTLYATCRGRVCTMGAGLTWSGAVEGWPTPLLT